MNLVRSRPRRARRRARVIALALAALALPALALHVHPAAAGAAAPPTIDVVRRALEQRRQVVRSVRADVVVRIQSPTWSATGSCEGLLAARRPGSLRLAGYAAVMTLFDTATDGRRFWVDLPGASTFYTGAAGQESLLTRLPVPPGQIVSAVFGEPYGALDSTLIVTQERGTTWLRWQLSGGRTVRARAALDPLRLESAELWDGDQVEARISYRDYRKRHGVWWPTRLEFEWPGAQTKLALEFGTVTFNPQLEDSLFVLAPRAGSQVLLVGEEAR